MFLGNMVGVGDCETLCKYSDAIVLSFGFTVADITKPLTFKELIEYHTFFFKFKTQEQLNAGRKSSSDTLSWWKSDKVSDEARKVSLMPYDTDRSMTEFADALKMWCHERGVNLRDIDVCDRNLFDFSKLAHMQDITLNDHKNTPWHYHNVFDVTSVLKAYGAGRYGGIDVNDIEGFCYHDPRHDSALDWLRLQKNAHEAGAITVEGWPEE